MAVLLSCSLEMKKPAGRAGFLLLLIQVWQIQIIKYQFLEIYFRFVLCGLQRFPECWLLTSFPQDAF
jgi:hypothetical protein